MSPAQQLAHWQQILETLPTTPPIPPQTEVTGTAIKETPTGLKRKSENPNTRRHTDEAQRRSQNKKNKKRKENEELKTKTQIPPYKSTLK